MIDLIKREPALVGGVVVALLGVLVAFKVPVTTEQRDAIVAFVYAVLALVGALYVRSRVSPVK